MDSHLQTSDRGVAGTPESISGPQVGTPKQTLDEHLYIDP